jgi:hypothetical protein
MTEPSISVPLLDFFGLPHGRFAEHYSLLTTSPSGLGLNSYLPIPFARSLRIELVNETKHRIGVTYQIDYTLEPAPESATYLHATFRRENPTVLRRDFVIAEGFKGPGRFLGCVVGIRPLDTSVFYGEGELKIYRDGDREFPTICGTGLDDYIGSAGGLAGHSGPYAGAPLVLLSPDRDQSAMATPDFLGFYRWHVPDPVMFQTDLRVTLQQIGHVPRFTTAAEVDRYQQSDLLAGPGWVAGPDGSLFFGLAERQDDYCATAFVYCRTPLPVPRYDTEAARADLDLLPYERRALAVPSTDPIDEATLSAMLDLFP